MPVVAASFVSLRNQDLNVSEIRSYSEKVVLIWVDTGLGSFLVPATVCIVYRREAEAEEWESSACSVSLFEKHTLICEGLERALLRMHRSILTLCICGILCLFLHGAAGDCISRRLCHLTSQNQFTPLTVIKDGRRISNFSHCTKTKIKHLGYER